MGLKMEYRKLISFGRNSYVVSMPKSWVIKNKLRKGDLMSVNDNGNEITISLSSNNAVQTAPREITIQTENKEINLIKTEIVSAYLNNYDIINIYSNTLEKNALEIKNILRNLTGMEVMEQTSKRIVAKDLINKSEISLKVLIRRMDVITRAMIDDAIESIDGESHYESIDQRDNDVNRLHFLSYRVIRGAMKDPSLAKTLKMEPWELFISQRIMMRLEKIADRQKRITRYLRNIKLKKSVAKDLKKLYSHMRDKYLEVMKAYYNNDKTLAFAVEVSNKDRILACENFHKKSTGCPMRIKRHETQSYCTELSRIVDNLKAMTTSIKNLSRVVISMD